MRSLWDDRKARGFVERYGPSAGEALALRVYTSQLIGGDPALVLHGGGNTSVKDEAGDLLGTRRRVLFVKGSGRDLAAIGPGGFPALELEGLLQLRSLRELSDEEMVNQLRTHLLDASAPNPSVEALLHAFLPHRYVDHSHAEPILALSNQEQGAQHLAAALGPDILVLPYVKPGFPLALQVVRAVEETPEAQGAVLEHHGLFTWGASARESYERHIRLVDAAERYLHRHPAPRAETPSVAPAEAARRAARFAPVLRGATVRAADAGRNPAFILEWRGSEPILAVLGSREGRALALTPPLTPDHALRTKSLPCWIGGLDWDGAESGWRAATDAALADYVRAYEDYFRRGVEALGPRTPLDPAPRVLLLPGCGLFGAGPDSRAARIAADIGERSLAVKAAAAGLGSYRGLSETELFDVEYWSLEQAKLGKHRPAPLAGRVAAVTGGGGAIGEAIGEALTGAGAVVFLLDSDPVRAGAAAARIREAGGVAQALEADVTRMDALEAAFAEICRRCGGLDILVPNAGIAAVAPLLELEPAEYRRVAEVNQTGVLLTLQAGGRVLAAQGTGGSVVIVSSKNVLGPGAAFGAYSASKAGAHQLGRVAALEWAGSGIRVNMVAPDAVFAHRGNPSGLWSAVGPERARARGLDAADLPRFYMDRNLLKRAVRAEDVARAVLFLAADATATTGAVLPVDGGLPEAFPR